jgi:protein-disulfide isomerase
MSPPLFTRRSSLAFAATVAAGLGASWWLRGQAMTGPALTLTPVVRTVLEDPGSPRAGPADADVTLVVFTDYRCSICQATDGALDRLLAEDPRARVIFKDWPIRGPGSELAARAALAAHRQGRYRALHTAMMASRGPLDPARIEAIAAAAGLDLPRLRADLADHADLFDAQLARHAFQAFSLGLQGTPAYLVGPYLMQGGLDDRQLAAAVRRARRAGPPT